MRDSSLSHLQKTHVNSSARSRILLVECDELFHVDLSGSGLFNVELAPANDALSGFSAQSFDIIVITCISASQDVKEVVGQLKAGPGKNLPLLLVSSEALRVTAGEFGVDEILTGESDQELFFQIGKLVGGKDTRKSTEIQTYALLDQAPAVMAVLKGPEHVFELANKKYMELVGVHRKILGQPVRVALPEVVEQGFIGLLDDVYRSGKPFIGNEVKVALEQTEAVLHDIYMNFIYRPIISEAGVVEGIFVHGVNVSDLVNARKKAEDAEQRLSSIIDQATAGIAQVDVEGRFTLTNERFCNMLGYTREELSNLTMRDITHADDVAANLRLVHNMLQTGETYSNEKRFLRKDGSILWVNNSVSVIKDHINETTNILAVVIDISDKKMAEEKLRKSEQLFKTYSDALPQMAFIADRHGDIIFFNQRWYDYIGTLRNTEGWGWTEQPVHHPDDVQRTLETWKHSLAEGSPYQIEYRLRRHDGEYRWHLGRAVPVRNSEGAIELWLGTNTDIHDQKEAQEQLKAMTENLESLVRERTMALQRSNEDLQQFAHVASHDLKEPVRKIRIFVNMLLDRFNGVIDKQALSYIGKIQGASERLKVMIEGVLAYSSVNATQQPIEEVDLNSILRQVQTDLEIVIHEKKAVITSDVLPAIKGAGVLLHQLFYNLLNNSLKFIRSEEQPQIHVSCYSTKLSGKPAVGIIVRDNGIGFSNEYAERIFETFTRLNTKDHFEGTGLGLALCKKIVHRHGGEISARGAVDRGAEITILLPIEQEKLTVI